MEVGLTFVERNHFVRKSAAPRIILFSLQCIIFPSMFAGLKDHVHHERTRFCLDLGKETTGLIQGSLKKRKHQLVDAGVGCY